MEKLTLSVKVFGEIKIMGNKPLNGKAYTSISHLPNSRLGLGDHHISLGQARIATEKTRDKFDLIIVQEKLDGSNVCVAKINDVLYPLIRAGYVANTSRWEQHQLFYKWAMQNYSRFDKVLQNGERLCGEWLLQAHGTRYNLPHEPFVVFDLINENGRLCYSEFKSRIGDSFILPKLLHSGSPISVKDALKLLGTLGFHGAIDEVEGVVYRVERKGKVEFICKFVRHDKVDGKYLEEQYKGKPVWNCNLEL